MVLPGMNPEKIYLAMILRAWQDSELQILISKHWVPQWTVIANSRRPGSFILMGLNATWFALVSVILMVKVVS